MSSVIAWLSPVPVTSGWRKKERSMAKVFLLTGSSRGLGRQTAEATRAPAHRLIATARQPLGTMLP
jgi:hypothetical protein